MKDESATTLQIISSLKILRRKNLSDRLKLMVQSFFLIQC